MIEYNIPAHFEHARMRKLHILPQPNDVTCGPTCLHALYHYYQDDISLQQVIEEVRTLPEGGTLAVYLGLHALARGYQVTLNVINLEVFDPTWFRNHDNLILKLKQQLKYKHSERIRIASRAFIEFIEQGGKIISKDISSRFLKTEFCQERPIITGLNSTYLYQCAREVTVGNRSIFDDLRGLPCGHFVVLNGYFEKTKKIQVADPYAGNPVACGQIYSVRVSRLINAIMLGAMTYDSNLLFIRPKG